MATDRLGGVTSQSTDEFALWIRDECVWKRMFLNGGGRLLVSAPALVSGLSPAALLTSFQFFNGIGLSLLKPYTEKPSACHEEYSSR